MRDYRPEAGTPGKNVRTRAAEDYPKRAIVLEEAGRYGEAAQAPDRTLDSVDPLRDTPERMGQARQAALVHRAIGNFENTTGRGQHRQSGGVKEPVPGVPDGLLELPPVRSHAEQLPIRLRGREDFSFLIRGPDPFRSQAFLHSPQGLALD